MRKRKIKFKRILLLGLGFAAILSLVLTLLIPKETRESLDPDRFVQNNGFMVYQEDAYTSLQGIDVSQHNGVIDWEQVKASSIDFAMIRIGYRGAVHGELYQDEQFADNVKGAREQGIKVGVYWYSSAVTEEELDEECALVLEMLANEKLDLPVAYDMEIFNTDTGRINSLSTEQKTDLALRFCEKIEQAGYDTMIYGNLDWLYHQLDFQRIEAYPIWYAAYQEKPAMTDPYLIWQYSHTGQISGISGNTDLNVMVVKKEGYR